MAKVRIFELARDLNMKSKDLLDKLGEMGIEAKSHMSSLEDEAVEAIRSAVAGTQKVKLVEETRIQPTVIRRRKKVVKQDLEIVIPVIEPEDDPAMETVLESSAQEPTPQEETPTPPAERKPVLRIVKRKPVEETPARPEESEAEPEPEPKWKPKPETEAQAGSGQSRSRTGSG